MGNSSSKNKNNAPSASYISNPGPLKDKGSDAGVHRRATSHVNNHSSPSVSAEGIHRRSKSALVGSAAAPPPSYQEAVFLTVPGQDTLPVPPSQPLHRSRSQDATGSRNPFRQRPTSFNGATASQSNVATSSAGGSGAGATSDHSASPALGLGTSASAGAPKWTTEEERLAYLRKPMRQESYENALETLRKYNTVIVVDDSSSMTKYGRWKEARSALATLAETAAQYDTDGIDVCFLNSPKEGRNLKNALLVRRLFDSVLPNGLTPIGDKLDKLLRSYINDLDIAKNVGREESVKPVNFIILTDGAATDDPADVIVNAARRLDNGGYLLSQVGIQFVQIGDDKNATEFLRQLDDEIAGGQGVRDIVDTTPYLGSLNAEMIIKILLGGINRRVDRKGGLSVMSG